MDISVIPEVLDNEAQKDYMERCVACLEQEKMPEKQKLAICTNRYLNSIS